ncbi:hypothetical protein GKZ28_24400 [Clostridium chromiireducens]|uniref:Uncharacterized protein n=1 Tax=Clostridium chromiireducens TaxID=225345 RepID=A0A964RRY5_9CLOT|nr:hypothetical protein [Clostridium chromiireducens]MVX66809.1 hypothetical protein [Clostridium chromiireducens]
MIYEYPEDFVVPVVYTRDLNPMYREWEVRYVYVDESRVPFDQSEEDKISHINKNEELRDIYIYPFNSDENTYSKKICCDNLIDDNLDDVNAKYILSDIDDEYANSETLRI